MSRLREKLQGEVTFSKGEFALIVVVASLVGVLLGLLTAPYTHGVTVCCGNNSGNSYGECGPEEGKNSKDKWNKNKEKKEKK